MRTHHPAAQDRVNGAAASAADASARARLAALLESSNDAILAKDLDGIVTAWNPAAVRLYGYSAEEIIGCSVSTIIPRELAGENAFILAEIAAGRRVPPYDTERVTKDGQRVSVSVSVSPILDSAGGVVGASTIAHDITGRLKAAAEQVRAMQLVRQTADAIVALDADGRISHWNPAAMELFGYSVTEALGAQPWELIRSTDTKARAELYTAVLEGGRTRRYEASLKHRDGADIVAQVSIAPLSGAGGEPAGAVVSVHDLTARRIAERRLRQARDREAVLLSELEQTRRLESVGRLAGGVAHDFNNILGVILNLAALVAAELPEGSSGRADAREIELAAKRAARLIRQLLIFSHRDVERRDTFDPGQVVAELEHFLRSALGPHVRLRVRADAAPRTVTMDRGQLEQVIVNLAVNGRDAMPAGGRLTIETSSTDIDEEFAAAHVGLAPGRYVTLTVTDTGTGMTPEALEHAFEPFFSTKDRSAGTGLGLATVYGIVTKANGRVAIDSEPGRGTTLRVDLPESVGSPDLAEHPTTKNGRPHREQD